MNPINPKVAPVKKGWDANAEARKILAELATLPVEPDDASFVEALRRHDEAGTLCIGGREYDRLEKIWKRAKNG